MQNLRIFFFTILALVFVNYSNAQNRKGDRSLILNPVNKETTAQIMEREKTAKVFPRVDHELEIDHRRKPNPLAKPIASYPENIAVNKANTPATPAFAQTLSTNFTGATLAETNSFPPDDMGTVGPAQYIVFVNGRLRSFTKAGVADGVLNVKPDVFFASVMTPVGGAVVLNFTSDPRIRYDRQTGKWILLIIDVPCTNATCTATAANRVLIAISDGPTITAGTVWTFTQFQGDAGTNFLDYPTLGIDANAIYIGGNMFTSAGSFIGTNGYVLQKTPLFNSGTCVVTQFSNLAAGAGAGPLTPQGVDNFDLASTDGYFVGVDNAAFSLIVFRRVSNPGSATPTISGNISVTVPTTTFPNPITHLGNTGGSNGRLDALDDRLYAAVIRNGRLWTAHNFRVSAAGVANTAAAARNAVRWYEFQNLSTTPTLVQTGTVFDNAATLAAAAQYWNPSIMVSGQGHAAIGMCKAGTAFNINAATAGRLNGETLGTMQAPQTTTSSASEYNPASDPGGASGRRWGDYSYVSLDPLDDMTMWMINQFCDANNSYGCKVTKLLAPPPSTPAIVSPSSIASGLASVSVTLTGTVVTGSGFYDPGANLPAPALAFNHIAGSIPGVTINSITYTSPTQVTLNLNTVGTPAGTVPVTITNPDGQSTSSASNILTITAPVCPTITVTNPATTTGTVGIAFSENFSASGGAPAYTFTTASTLPAGLTLSPAGVLSGTPTAIGTFPIVVVATDLNTCSGTGATYNLVISCTSNTIALSSAPGTDAQTVCINTAITDITYSTTGATGATFSGLPTGVTGNWAANVVTISGTPTASGTFNYSVILTGGCGAITANGTITVTSAPASPVITAGGSTSICGGGSVVLTAAAFPATDLNYTTTSTGTIGIDQWQSFAPTVSGGLTAIAIYTNSCPPGGTSTFTLYSGVGTGGAVLNTQTVTISGCNSSFIVNLPNISLTAGNNYTFRFLNTGNPSLLANNTAPGSYFSSDYGLNPGWKLNFTTTMTSLGGTYQWFNNGILIPGETASTYTANAVGNYTCKTFASGCYSLPSNSIAVINTVPVTPAITAGGPVTFCTPGSVTLTAAVTPVTDLSFSTISTGTTGANQWQSFVPTIDGLTTAIEIYLNGPTNVAETFNIYKGIGTLGTLVHSQSISINAGPGVVYAINIPGGVHLTPGTDYTFQLTGTNLQLIANNGSYGSYFSSNYGLNPGWRLDFITTVTPFLTPQWYNGATLIGGATSPTYSATTSGVYTCVNGVTGCYSPASNSITVTVTPLNTITLTSAPGTDAQTLLVNTPITNITYSTTGATGATFSGLPAGVTGNWAGNVVTISGSPTTGVGSPFNYSVTLTGGCGTVTANGTITVNLATPATGLNFDGVNDRVSIGTQPVSSINNFTFEAWVYTSSTANQAIYAEGLAGNNNPMFSIIKQTSGFEIVLRNAFGTGLVVGGTNGSVPLNTWTHVAFVRTSATTAKLYINGLLTDNFNFADPGAIPVNVANLGVRQRAGFDAYFNGSMDEVRIWSRSLCQAEIQNNMTCELNPAGQTGLVSLYHFNQGFVNADNTGINTLTDNSGNGNNGTLNNFALTGAASNWATGNATGTCAAFVPPARYYVNAAVVTSGNGSTWGTAFKTIQEAINGPAFLCGSKEIWVAKGTYYPTNSTDRNISFDLPDGVKLYGGFAGGEITTVGRDFVTNETILSGEIGAAGAADNSYNVMRAQFLGTASRVDGFTIRDGNADVGSTVPICTGGGLFVRSGNNNLTIENIVFKNNNANFGGGLAMATFNAGITNSISHQVINCSFINNTAANRGGGMYIQNSSGDISNMGITGTIFTGNSTPSNGGGINANLGASDVLSMTNCIFNTNTANSFGGAGFFDNAGGGAANINITGSSFINNRSLYGGGGIVQALSATSAITFTKCLLTGNIADNGAGTVGSGGAFQSNTAATLTLINCILTDNQARGTGDDGGGGIMLYGGTGNIHDCTFNNNSTNSSYNTSGNSISAEGGTVVNVRNSIIWGAAAVQVRAAGTINYTNSDVKGAGLTAPNLSIDPLFVNAAANDLHLLGCSPAINAGSNAAIPPGLVTDFDGNPRVFNTTVDMGAYEYQANPTGLVAAFTISPAAVQCLNSNNFTFNNTSTIATGTITGYNWTFGDATTSTATSPSHVYAAAGTFTVKLVVTGDNGCKDSVSQNVTVNPTSNATATPATQTICSASAITTIVLTGSIPGTVYNWTRDNTGSVTGIAASGAGDISGTLTNTTNAPVTVTFTITPSYTNAGITCTGTPVIATVTVNPYPVVALTPATQTICSANTIDLTVTPALYSPANFEAGSLASNRGIFIDISNNSAIPISVSSIRLQMVPPASGSTINGQYNIYMTTTATTAVGNYNVPAAWTLLSSPVYAFPAGPGNIAYFGDVALGGNSFALAPGQSKGIYLVGVTANFNIAYRSAAFLVPTVTDAAITLTSRNSSGTNFTATGVDRTYYGIIGYTGGYTYSWTRDNTTNITGPNSGTTFPVRDVLTNTTNSPQTTIYTVTASSGGCNSTATASVVVNPVPNAVATPSAQTICSGTAITTIALTGNVAGTVYNWTRDNTAGATGIAASGAGNITGSLTNTTNTPVTVTFTITPSYTNAGTICTGTPITATVVVNPIPNTAATPASQTICSASAITTIVLTGNVIGTVYNWVRDNTVTVTGIAASGTGDISGSLTNTTNAPVTVTFTITPSYTNAGTTCTGTPVTATVVVNPIPNAVATPSSQTSCSASAITTIALTGNVAGTVYNWTRNNPGITGIATSGSGDINGSLTNTTNAPVTVTFTITPSYTNAGTTCTGTPITATVTVNPTPDVAQPANQVVCNNVATAAVNFTGSVAGTIFNWTNNTPSIGLAASGSGDIASFTATNTTNAPVTAIVTVTPSTASTDFAYITNFNSDNVSVINRATQSVIATIPVGSRPQGITVNSAGSRAYVSNNGGNSVSVINTVTNTVIASIPVGTNPRGLVVSPDGTKLFVANGGGNDVSVINTATNTVVATIPGNNFPFGVAISPDGTSVYVSNAFSNTISVISTATNTITATLTGSMNGPRGVTVSPDGTRLYVANNQGGNVSVFNSLTNTFLATITTGSNPIAVAIKTDGTKAYVSNAGSNTVSVINIATNTVSTNISASSPFNIAVTPDDQSLYVSNQVAGNVSVINTATNVITATVGVGTSPAGIGNFMLSGAPGCTGTSKTFTITVNPTPTVNTVPNQVICNGAPTTAVNFSSPATGGTIVYNWTNNTTSIGLAGSGSGNIASFTAVNTGTAPVTATITVTPTYTNGGTSCVGTASTFTITVNPTTTVTTVPNQVVCNGAATTAVNFTSPTTGGSIVYNWTNNTTSIGLAASGTGDIASFTATNATNAVVTATITVTPAYTNGGTTCTGTPRTFTITVNPTPTVDVVASQVVCNGAPTAPVYFNGNMSGTICATANENGTAVLTAPAGTVITRIIFASYGTPNGSCGTYTIGGCHAASSMSVVSNLVLGQNSVSIPANNTTFGDPCGGTVKRLYIQAMYSPVAGQAFNWTNNTTSIGLAASGTGNIASFTASNATNAPVTATVTVTPTYTNGGTTCTGTARTFTITVNPTPTVNPVPNQVICNGAPTSAVNFTSPTTGGTIVYNWTNNITSIGLAASGSGNVASFTAINTGTAPVTATITVTPSYTNGGTTCTGPAITFTITVNPTAIVNPVTNQVVCNNTTTTAVNFSSPTTGGTIVYNWTNNTTSIGLAASGAGNIASFTATNATNAPVVATIMVTPSYTNGGTTCVGTPITFTITVNPTATVNAVPNQVVCNNTATTAVNFTSPTTGGTIVYNWTNNTTSIGLAASGTGNIASFTATNITNAPVTATITVTPSYTNAGVTCIGTPVTFTITVNPTAVINPVANQVVCNNAATTAVNFTSPTTGGTIVYNWTNNTASIGLAASGAGNIASFTATNITNTPVTAMITVTPAYTNGGVTCIGTPISFTITVNPTATVSPVANQVVCNNSPTAAVNFSSPTTGGTIIYNWTNNDPFIGLASVGTGNIASFIAINATNAPETATITVTPSYTNGGVTCIGTPMIFTITVNPTATIDPVANQVLCNGANSTPVNFTSPTTGGTIVYNWTNSLPSIGLAASGSGNIPTFVAVNPGPGPVTATVTVTPTYTNGAVSCVGTPITFTITVNPPPVVNPVASQVVCNGASTANINFTTPVSGGIIVFNWTNNTPSIGLPASGTGDILSFLATNATNAPVVATLTVTMSYTNGGITCVSLPVTFTITVNPTPQVNQPANQVVCAGVLTAPVNFTGPVAGTVFNWTNNTPSIGLAAGGTGNIPAFTAVNATNAPIVATITVTPGYTNGGTTCTGPFKTFTITVNPTPTVAPVSNKAYCTGATTQAIPFNGTAGNAPGTVYNWTNSNPAIGLAASGTGDIMPFVTTNATNGPLVATIVVTPVGPTGCVGTPITFTITVNPAPVVNPVTGQVLCNGSPTAVISFTSPTTGPTGALTFQWTNSAPSIGLAANGTGNIPSFTAINTGLSPVIAILTVTAVYTNAGITCTGNSQSFTITVNPTPTVNPVANQVLCNGSNTAAVNFTGSVFGTIYNWTNNNTSIGLAASGAGNIASFVATNATNVPQVATITVTPNYTNGVTCPGTPITFTITVNPIPGVNPPASQVVCAGATVTQTFTGPVTGTVYNWTNTNTAIGLGASGTGNLNFTATNTTGAPITGTITVTPSYTNGGGTCTGTPQTFTITVNPVPTVNAVAPQVLCNGATTAAVTFTGAVPGTVYNWTNTNTTIGLAASGTGNIASFTATNATAVVQTATITVTPTYTNGATTCTGTPVTFTITVNPTPSVNTIANQTVCNGTATTAVTIAGPVAGTVYSWTNNNLSIGLGASGTGNIPSFTAINTGSTPVTATITVTPTFTNGGISCTGASITFTITVNPTATVNQPANQLLCNGATTSAVVFSGLPAGSVYNWTNSNPAIGLAASGTGNIPGFTATNNTAAPITAIITVTPTASGCGGGSVSFTITVNPTPSVNAIANQSVCTGASTAAVTISGPVAGTVYTWTNNNTTIGLGASGIGNIPAFITVNPTNAPVTATITVTPSYTNGGVTCTGNPVSFTITVSSLANLVFINVPPRVCITDTIVALIATPAGGIWTGPGIVGNTFNAAIAGVGVHLLTYTVVNAGGCTSIRTASVVVNDCIERHNVFQQAIRIWPNPNQGRFSIQFNSDVYKEFKVKVVNAKGQEMGYYEFKNLVYGQILPFDLSRLASGQYFLYVYNSKESGVFPVIIAR